MDGKKCGGKQEFGRDSQDIGCSCCKNFTTLRCVRDMGYNRHFLDVGLFQFYLFLRNRIGVSIAINDDHKI